MDKVLLSDKLRFGLDGLLHAIGNATFVPDICCHLLRSTSAYYNTLTCKELVETQLGSQIAFSALDVFTCAMSS